MCIYMKRTVLEKHRNPSKHRYQKVYDPTIFALNVHIRVLYLFDCRLHLGLDYIRNTNYFVFHLYFNYYYCYSDNLLRI